MASRLHRRLLPSLMSHLEYIDLLKSAPSSGRIRAPMESFLWSQESTRQKASRSVHPFLQLAVVTYRHTHRHTDHAASVAKTASVLYKSLFTGTGSNTKTQQYKDRYKQNESSDQVYHK